MMKFRAFAVTAVVLIFWGLFTSLTGAAPGDLDPDFSSVSFDAGGNINVAAVQPDGKIIVAGAFVSVTDETGSYSRLRIARLNADGTVDTGFGVTGSGASGTVECVEILPDGKILIGGSFNSVTDATGSVSRLNIARLNPDGSVDTTFGTDGNGPNSTGVLSMAVLPDGKVLVSGAFSAVSDPTGNYFRLRLARLNSDGSVDIAFGSELKGFNNLVYAIAPLSDGKIIAGGDFTDVSDAVDDYNRSRIARLHPDGSVDATFGSDSKGASDVVHSITMQEDGKLIIGGAFNLVSDSIASHDSVKIARLNPDGTVDTAFNSGGRGFNGTCFAVSLQADGKVLAGGNFSSFFNGVTSINRFNVARLNADGSFDEGLGSDGYGAAGPLRVVQTRLDGRIFVAGEFSDVVDSTGAQARKKVAVLENDPATSELTAPDLSTVSWTLGGAAPVLSRVVFESSTDGGNSYAALGDGVRVAGGWALTDATIPAGARVRARGFLRVGSRNGSAGIVEETTGILFSNNPVLSLRGAKKITTTKSKLILKGTASDPDGDLTAVRFLDSRLRGKRWRAAKGTSSWSAAAVLKPGRNKVQIQAFDSRQTGSKVQKVTIIRK
jgi:uncharacterized delta-60 repeat protein